MTPLLRQASKDHPVVVLSGARQVGKSTLLREADPFAGWRYATLDNYDTRERADKDPESLWAGTGQIVIDEVQRSPSLLSAVKEAVDRRNRSIRFALSGSANLLLMQKIAESLAGRAVYLNLLPMTYGERASRPPSGLLEKLFSGQFPEEGPVDPPGEPTAELMLRGFFPPLETMSWPAGVLGWWEGYIATYLERDLRQISSVDSLTDFRRVMEALALRSGNILNQTEVARDTGVSQATVHRYTNLVEVSSLLFRIPAFAENRTRRLIKSPKVHWVDPGLAAFLSGIHDPEYLRTSREAGAFFETLVFLHLAALTGLMVPRPRLFHWRTVSGSEIDFVLEQGRRLVAVEAKYTGAARYADTRNLRTFLDEYPETAAGLLVYDGREIVRLHEKIVAVPWSALG
jgi:predicted AAA+ superfamily ATPase